MDAMTNDFGEVLLWSFWFFIWIAALMVWFRCLFDMFGDHTLSGWAKAGWAILLIFVPWVGALIYLIARGRSMTERQMAKATGDAGRSGRRTSSRSRAPRPRRRPDRQRQGAARLRRHRPERVRRPEGQGARLKQRDCSASFRFLAPTRRQWPRVPHGRLGIQPARHSCSAPLDTTRGRPMDEVHHRGRRAAPRPRLTGDCEPVVPHQRQHQIDKDVRLKSSPPALSVRRSASPRGGAAGWVARAKHRRRAVTPACRQAAVAQRPLQQGGPCHPSHPDRATGPRASRRSNARTALRWASSVVGLGEDDEASKQSVRDAERHSDVFEAPACFLGRDAMPCCHQVSGRIQRVFVERSEFRHHRHGSRYPRSRGTLRAAGVVAERVRSTTCGPR